MYDRSILETIDYHHAMLADDVRMRSFLRAILKTVNPGDVVLDIGSGTGILAYFACLAGARKVYAVEQDPLVGLAQTICRQNGFLDRVTFLNEWSDQVELPERVDMLITETIGNMGFEEGILGWVIDAKARLLADGGRIVPETVELMVVPTESKDTYGLLGDWGNPVYSLDFSPVAEVVGNNLLWSSLSPDLFLSTPASVFQADLATVESADISAEIRFEASRDGLVRGLGCWFRSTLFPGITITNGPPFATPSWTQILLPLARPLRVAAGDILHVQIQADHNSAHWHWQVSSEQLPAEQQSHSTLAGRLLQVADEADSKQKPGRNLDGDVDLAILQMMDGSTSLAEIARRLTVMYPLQCGNFDEILNHVLEVTGIYGRRPNDRNQSEDMGSNGYRPDSIVALSTNQ